MNEVDEEAKEENERKEENEGKEENNHATEEGEEIQWRWDTQARNATE